MSSPECAPSLSEMVSFKALLDNRLTAWEPEGVVPEMLIRPEMLNHSRTLPGEVLATLIDPAGGPLGDLADDAFDKIIATNVKSAFQRRNMAIPAMATRLALKHRLAEFAKHEEIGGLAFRAQRRHSCGDGLFGDKGRQVRTRTIIVGVVVLALAAGAGRTVREAGSEVARAGADFVVEYLWFVGTSLISHLPEIVFAYLLIKAVQRLLGRREEELERDVQKWAQRE